MKLTTPFCVLSVFTINMIGTVNNQGAFFEPYQDDKGVKSKDATMSAMFHKSFHQCSIQDDCNYVMKHVKSNKYSKIKSEEDLPVNRDEYQIWKKNDLKKMEEKVPVIEVKEQGFESCKQAQAQGKTQTGTVVLELHGLPQLNSYCDMNTDGGGWTVFQRRIDGSVDFKRPWIDYVNGFGNSARNFWLGLDALHSLTSAGNVVLRVELKHEDGDQGYAEYENFKIGSKADNYKLDLGVYSGNITDGFRNGGISKGIVGMAFSTYDNDNDESTTNCAVIKGGGWWFSKCGFVRLNAVYPSPLVPTNEEISWKSWKNSYAGITFSEMKLRVKDVKDS